MGYCGNLWSIYGHFLCFVTHFTDHSPTNKSSVRESGKAKPGAAEKASTGVTAARADTKGRGTPDHHGELLKV